MRIETVTPAEYADLESKHQIQDDVMYRVVEKNDMAGRENVPKSIWHKLPEQPEKGRDVLEKWHQNFGIHYTHFVSRNGIAEDNPFTDAWCYLDDLLACEKELADTKNKLDRAIRVIQEVSKMSDKLSRKYGDTLVEQLDTIQAFCWEQGYILTHDEDFKRSEQIKDKED